VRAGDNPVRAQWLKRTDPLDLPPELKALESPEV
jgi:hypothetical protein